MRGWFHHGIRTCLFNCCLWLSVSQCLPYGILLTLFSTIQAMDVFISMNIYVELFWEVFTSSPTITTPFVILSLEREWHHAFRYLLSIHLRTAACVLYEKWYRGKDMVLKVSFDFKFHLHQFFIWWIWPNSQHPSDGVLLCNLRKMLLPSVATWINW